MQRLESPPPECLLDVACGTGRLGAMIRATGLETEIVGVDLSPEMIAIARERFRDDSGMQWQVASAESLPMEDASFDTVVCANAFHLIPDQSAAAREFHRVLQPGGRLIVMDWCREYLTMAALLCWSRRLGRQYRVVLRSDELSELIEAAGFRTIDADRFKATWFWGLMILRAERTD